MSKSKKEANDIAFDKERSPHEAFCFALTGHPWLSLSSSNGRTTLFAVMAADVIMLNLWAHDVGRADGLAYTVLRSVLEEAARLLQEGRDLDPMENAAQRGRGSRLTSSAEAARFPKVMAREAVVGCLGGLMLVKIF